MSSPEITMEEYESLVIPELEAARGMQTRRPWTPREEAILSKYYPDPSIPLAKIAEVLDRQVSAVSQRAQRMGLSRV